MKNTSDLFVCMYILNRDRNKICNCMLIKMKSDTYDNDKINKFECFNMFTLQNLEYLQINFSFAIIFGFFFQNMLKTYCSHHLKLLTVESI